MKRLTARAVLRRACSTTRGDDPPQTPRLASLAAFSTTTGASAVSRAAQQRNQHRHGRPLTRVTARVALGGALVAVALAGAGVAQALWSMAGSVPVPAIKLGAVSFDAFGQSGTTTPQYSPDGGPVTLTLPGSDIVKVLDQIGPNPPPVIWQFTVEGYAQGIAGLDVDVSLGAQVGPGGLTTDLADGVARPGTLLALSTLKVYPASVNGDCSATPEAPDDDPSRQLHLFDAADHVVQAPGTFAGGPAQQVWCVAVSFSGHPDGAYANEAQASATGEDGDRYGALATWGAVVVFPPSLDPLGLYRNRADVLGLADDGTFSRDSAVYEAMIYPDPTNEPAVTILLDPTVTTLRA